MKGGLVVVAWALKALAAAGVLPSLPEMRVVIVADEEVGSPEGQAIIRESIQGAKGRARVRGRTKGRSRHHSPQGNGLDDAHRPRQGAHAGIAHKEGVNALWALAKLVDRVQMLDGLPSRRHRERRKVVRGTSKTRFRIAPRQSSIFGSRRGPTPKR